MFWDFADMNSLDFRRRVAAPSRTRLTRSANGLERKKARVPEFGALMPPSNVGQFVQNVKVENAGLPGLQIAEP